MTWYTLKTTYGAEALPASDVNDITRNINTLKNPPSDNYEADEASNYTTTSTTFVDVDATNLSITITTNGGDVMVHFHGVVYIQTTDAVDFNVDIDGSPVAADDGIIGWHSYNSGTVGKNPVSFTRLIIGTDNGGSLSAASHTFKLQWKVTASTATLYAGAGTSELDYHPQFWVREVS